MTVINFITFVSKLKEPVREASLTLSLIILEDSRHLFMSLEKME